MSRWFRRLGGVSNGVSDRVSGEVDLLCFPHAGGVAGFFASWAAALPGFSVHAVQYPGRQERFVEPTTRDVQHTAERVAADLVAGGLGRDRPLMLFGHSLGALVAYETARLCRSVPGVARLVVSGHRAPHLPRRGPLLHTASHADLVAHLGALGATDPRVLADPELLEVVLPPVRSDYRHAETYRHVPEPRLEIPVTALVGTEDPHVTVEAADGWAATTTGPFDRITLRGGHFALVSDQATVSDTLLSALRRTP